LNSSWLLPCRLYEGSLYGAVPIANRGVETSSWLLQRGAGVILNEPVEQHLLEFLRALSCTAYAEFANRIAAVPRKDLVVNETTVRLNGVRVGAFGE
jgi:hypothetical protein